MDGFVYILVKMEQLYVQDFSIVQFFEVVVQFFDVQVYFGDEFSYFQYFVGYMVKKFGDQFVREELLMEVVIVMGEMVVLVFYVYGLIIQVWIEDIYLGVLYYVLIVIFYN